MSRSYKKNPIVKDGHSGKFGKRLANRKVRHCKKDIANGKAYKKIFESWDIHDFVYRYPLIQLLRDQEAEEKAVMNDGVPDYRKNKRFVMTAERWKKSYKRK